MAGADEEIVRIGIGRGQEISDAVLDLWTVGCTQGLVLENDGVLVR